MIEKLRKNIDYLLNILLVVSLVISARSFIIDMNKTMQTGGVDLRDRVVAARVLLEGMDPYRFKWSEEYPETLLAPLDNPQLPVTRASFTPTVIMLHTPFAKLPYSLQRNLWFFAQWILLILSIFLFAKTTRSKYKARIIWIIGLFISATSMWRFHVERGQIYILYVFLITLSYYIYVNKWKYSHYLGGFILGFTASLRPTLVVMAIPMLLLKQRRMLIGIIMGALAGVLLCSAIFGVSLWSSYSSSLPYFEKHNLGEAEFSVYAFPEIKIIEGMDNLRLADPVPINNSSIQYILNEYFNVKLNSKIILAILIALLSLISIWIFRNRSKELSLSCIFLIAFMLVLVTDYFLPAVKSYYTEIQWLIPFELLVIEADALESIDSRSFISSLFFLLVGIYLNTMVVWEPYSLIISDYCIMIFLLIITGLIVNAWGRENEEQLLLVT